jgi:hypothetical protein
MQDRVQPELALSMPESGEELLRLKRCDHESGVPPGKRFYWSQLQREAT